MEVGANGRPLVCRHSQPAPTARPGGMPCKTWHYTRLALRLLPGLLAAPARRPAPPAGPPRPPAPQDLLPEDGAARRGRITIYCVAENIDRKALELRLRERGGNYLLQQYPDVLYGQIESTQVCAWVGGCRWDREGRRWVWRHGGALGRDCGGAPACMPLLGGK